MRKELRDRVIEYRQKDRFPISLFFVFVGVLLLMAGIQTGLVVLMTYLEVSTTILIITVLLYWSAVAIGLVLFTKRKIHRAYEAPLQKIAGATREVAKGDFSIYLPTIHTVEAYDYLDHMILDFNKMVEELGSIETLKTDFVSNVSHEMKTPIAVIKNYAKLLEQENLPEEQRMEYAMTISDASDRLSNLITNILKLNKLENQRIVPEMQRYDVCEQITECILGMETRLDDKNIELETNLDERVYITADAGLMELVWNNLLTNAIKFSEEGGLVEIQQMKEADHVEISVTDHGCGMSGETVAHIFEKFYQGDTSHASEGNGLGLALALRVLELMNGELQVESRVDEGSKFIVVLPIT